MEQKDMDLIWWSAYFKGNRRKGLSRLRLALDDPTLYGRLKGSFEAMSVVIGTSDSGSTGMMSVIYDSGKGDDLADAYAASTEYGSLDAFISGAPASILGNVMQMSDGLTDAVLENADVLAKLISDEGWLASLLSNEALLNRVMANPAGCEMLYQNDAARATLCSTPEGLGKMMAGCLGLDPAAYENGAEILASSSNMTSVASSPAVLNMICSDADLAKAFIDNGRSTGYSSAILATLKDATAFSQKGTYSYAASGYEATRYCNGANPDMTSAALSADACWVSVTYASCYGSSNYGWALRHLFGGNVDSSINGSTTHYVFPGGASFFSGTFSYAVYTPL